MSSLIVPVVKIESLTKHSNADTLEIARFKDFGWKSIVKIGEYQIGDLVIFVPPDCIIPNWLIENQGITYLKNNAGRTSTVKLRGEISEGVVINPKMLPIAPELKLGANLAEGLEITKWEPKELIESGPKTKKQRQDKREHVLFYSYTHIEHLSNFTGVLKPGTPVIITEKIHGTNFRFGWVRKNQLTLGDRIRKALHLPYSEYDYTSNCGRIHF